MANTEFGIPKFDRNKYFERRTGYVAQHLNSFSSLIPKDGLAVDIGCGEGTGAFLMAKRNLGVVGIDIDAAGVYIPFAVERAQKEEITLHVKQGGQPLEAPPAGEVVFVQGDACKDLSLTDASADLVTSFYTAGPGGVRENPWKKIYSEGARVLKPDGNYIVTTEQKENVLLISKFLADSGLDILGEFVTPDVVDKHVVIAKKK